MREILLLATALALASGAASAEVVDAQANGFEVRQVVHIAAPPDRVYDALAHIGAWWDSAHTYSGDAHHLSLEAKAGGCFCEVLADGGSAAHMRVLLAEPGKVLRLDGALGPMQQLGATGRLTWALAAKDGGTELTQTYDVGGYARGGLAQLAAPVDHVMGEQAERLKTWVETGKP